MKATRKLSISRTVYPLDYNKNNPMDPKDFQKWREYITIENGLKSIECQQFFVASKLIIGGHIR